MNIDCASEARAKKRSIHTLIYLNALEGEKIVAGVYHPFRNPERGFVACGFGCF